MWLALTKHPERPHRNTELMDAVTKIVCEYYQVPASALFTKTRTWTISHPRQMAMYVIKKTDPKIPYKTIATYFGNYHHTSVVHAITEVQGHIDMKEPEAGIFNVLNDRLQEWIKNKTTV